MGFRGFGGFATWDNAIFAYGDQAQQIVRAVAGPPFFFGGPPRSHPPPTSTKKGARYVRLFVRNNPAPALLGS
jgi:hypothetical protein